MVIWIAVISILCLFLSLILIKQKKIKIGLITLTGLITFISIVLFAVNTLFHFGMTKQNDLETKQIYSVSSRKQFPLLVYQTLNKDLSIYLYKDQPKGKNNNTDLRYHVNNSVQFTNNNGAILVKRETYWGYSNNFTKSFFNNNNDHEFIEQNNTFKIPKNWTVLTVKQSQLLGKKLKKLSKPTAEQKSYMKNAIGQKVKEAHLKNPQMTPQMDQKLINKITNELQQNEVQKVINDVKNKK
ncbi:DUF4811 domain-containing protein [Xylocopilactobacillus apis]|uniref:DUF4811 domain-containing protein n=1 Tax=Xylocopilactobacillus apis TaxID=2932183 RepID=A0AAU9D115_9LACO|nr:DUF4811 domain-containing protein [Xylocopilactobacillus apis]BDR56171.1 DUF4811 domain-containing protein [Xylocopilactobacillus apis]